VLLLADGLREGGNFASWGIPKMGGTPYPTMDEFLMENRFKMDDLGVPPF